MIEKLKHKDRKLLSWASIVVILYIMTLLQVPMVIKNLFLLITTSMCLFFLWNDSREEKWELAILFLGLSARIVFCLLDVYTDFELPIGGGSDSLAFLKTAEDYYYGDFHRQYTNYPYILYFIFQIVGINRFAAQYVNILCWSFSALIMQKCCKRLDICGNLRLIALAVFSWLPTNIWITSILYRDAYIMLFLLLSFYCLICWIQEGKQYLLLFSVGAVLAATWLHGASILSLIPIMFVIVFYSRDRKQFCVTKRGIMMVLAVMIAVMALFLIPQLRNTILRKIPNMENGLITGLNNYLVGKYDYSEGAGSNYLEGRYLTGYFDIIVMTVQRIYYHIMSPAPDLWRGIKDIIAFFGSSAPVYLTSMLLWAGSLFYKKKDVYRFVLFLEIFITVGVYAWGNVNGGSALRHREKILSLVILMAVYSLTIILKKRKEQKSDEKITV